MIELNKGYCLVLSGGGAKGVYHIGVWRALRELGIEVEAFVGASIGAVIAAFLAQGSDEVIEEIGRSIGLGNVLALPDELTENGEVKLDRDSLSAARELFYSFVKNKGLDTSPFRELIASKLDEGLVRRSGRNLGIVAVNLSELEPQEIYLEDMEEGKLVDYLMASSAFPGFERPVIGGKKYLDGGVYDNIPYSMVRKRGYRRVIISDISGAGRNRKPEIAGSITVYIKNSIEMGGVLDFNRDFLDEFMLLGYLDTLRVFGHLKGYSYFIEPNAAAEAAFAAQAAAGAAGGASPAGEEAPCFPEAMRHDRDLLLKRLECAASILEVPRVRRYGYEELAAAIDSRHRAEDEKLEALIKNGTIKVTGVVKMLQNAIANKSFDGSPYYYWRLAEKYLQGKPLSMAKTALHGFYPELAAGLDYLGDRS
jgi:NTE family protein